MRPNTGKCLALSVNVVLRECSRLGCLERVRSRRYACQPTAGVDRVVAVKVMGLEICEFGAALCKLAVRYNLDNLHPPRTVRRAGAVCQRSPNAGKWEEHRIMAQVVVNMKTIDLRRAGLQSVTGEDVKTLQALLNLFLSAGD